MHGSFSVYTNRMEASLEANNSLKSTYRLYENSSPGTDCCLAANNGVSSKANTINSFMVMKLGCIAIRTYLAFFRILS